MAVGDFVSGFSGDNTAISFQPALGVFVLITSTNTIATPGAQITDGVDFAYADTGTIDYANLKLFINNTHYLNLTAQGGGTHTSYSGIIVQ